VSYRGRGVAMKNFLLAGVVLVAVASGPALSADLPPRQAPPPIAPVVVAPVFSWTGCYIGANVGWARARVKVDWVANPVGYGTLGLVNAAALGSLSSNSVIGGGEVGCNLQTGFVVWGVEGDFQGTSLKQTR